MFLTSVQGKMINAPILLIDTFRIKIGNGNLVFAIRYAISRTLIPIFVLSEINTTITRFCDQRVSITMNSSTVTGNRIAVRCTTVIFALVWNSAVLYLNMITI